MLSPAVRGGIWRAGFVTLFSVTLVAICMAHEQARPQDVVTAGETSEKKASSPGAASVSSEHRAQGMNVQAWAQKQRAMHRTQSAQDRHADVLAQPQQGAPLESDGTQHGSWQRSASGVQQGDKASAAYGADRRGGRDAHAETGNSPPYRPYSTGGVDAVLPGAFGTIEGDLHPAVLEDTLAAADAAEEELYWDDEYEDEDGGAAQGGGHAYARFRDVGGAAGHVDASAAGGGAAGAGDRSQPSAHHGDAHGGGHGSAHGGPYGGGPGIPDGFASKYERQLFNLEEMLWANASMRDIPTAIQGLRVLAAQYTAKRPLPGRRPLLDILPSLVRARMDGHVVASPVDESLEWAASRALFVLSVLSSTGIAGHENPHNPDRALVELAEAVAAGSMEATAAMGARYAAGLGVPRDCQRALPYLRAVADDVVAVAEFNADFQLPRMEPVRLRDRERDGDYESHGETYLEEEQVLMEEDLAAHGDMEAQRAMGYRHLVGRGVERDEGAAVDHLQAAAAAGDGFAALNMGYVYLKGLHTPPDYIQARRFIQQAVDAGVPSAYNLMGVLHFNGWGTRQNYTAALHMFEKGAALGDPESLYSLGTLYAGGYGVQVSEATAATYFEEAHMAGHWRAPYTLATLLAQGSPSLPRNCTEAVELLRLFIEERGMWPDDMEDAVVVLDEGDAWGSLMRFAVIAEQGSAIATGNMAQILKHGRGCQGPPEACHVLAYQAATHTVARGDPEWNVDLGDMHYLGRGTPQNYTAAMEAYRLAASVGLAEGLYSLGYMHETGRGVQRNLTAAAELYWSASQVNAYEAVPALLSWVKVRALMFLQAFGAEAAFGRLLASLPGVPGLQQRTQLQGGAHGSEDGDKWQRLLVSAVAGLVGMVLGVWIVRWRRAATRNGAPAPTGRGATPLPAGNALVAVANRADARDGDVLRPQAAPMIRRRRTNHDAQYDGEPGPI
eukprot:jgi/Mesvir1/6039/Mv00778-RA.1